MSKCGMFNMLGGSMNPKLVKGSVNRLPYDSNDALLRDIEANGAAFNLSPTSYDADLRASTWYARNID